MGKPKSAVTWLATSSAEIARARSGIDLHFERLLASGRKAPTITEGTDSVHVTVPRRVVQPGVIRLLVEADRRYQLTQRERITFALIAQTEGVVGDRARRGARATRRCSPAPMARAASHVGARHATSCRPRSCAKLGSTQ